MEWGCWIRGVIRSRWSIVIMIRVRSWQRGGDWVRSVDGLTHSLIVTHSLILILIPPIIGFIARPPPLISQ